MVYVAPDSGLTNTFGFLNSGRYFEMLSSSRKWPSSYSIITATLVMGLVIEQIRNIVSGRIGLLASRSIIPCGLNQTTRPRRTTKVIAPAIRFSSMLRWTAVLIRSRRSEDTPTDSGLAVGSSCANAAAAIDAQMRAKVFILRCMIRSLRISGGLWRLIVHLHGLRLPVHHKRR